MTRTGVLAAGAVTVCVLAALCINYHRPLIVEDLTSRSTAVLQAAGITIPPNGLVFDGRDAILRGVQGSAVVSDQARDLVAALWGVRVVKLDILPADNVPAPVAPSAAKVVEQKVTEVLKLNSVEFDTGSANLTAVGRATLDKVAAELKMAPPGAPIGIYGYTDSVGDRHYNIGLSQRRADSTKAYLVGKGIDATRLTTKGFGPDQPVASNETEQGRQQNRRIEFSVKEIVVEKKENN